MGLVRIDPLKTVSVKLDIKAGKCFKKNAVSRLSLLYSLIQKVKHLICFDRDLRRASPPKATLEYYPTSVLSFRDNNTIQILYIHFYPICYTFRQSISAIIRYAGWFTKSVNERERERDRTVLKNSGYCAGPSGRAV